MTGEERRLRAAHEVGHALVAHAFGYEVLWIELAGPCDAITGWQRRDANRPEWRLNGHRAPPPDLGGWRDACDEIVITFAGEEAERLAGDLPALSPEAGALAAAQSVIEDVPIVADEPGAPWMLPMSDAELAERLLRGVTSSENEAAALRVALRCRAIAIVRTEQFRLALGHLAPILEQVGWLGGETLKVELERATVRASQASEGLDEAA